MSLPSDYLHEITNRALRQWVKLTGIDPSEERSRWSFGELDICEINEYIISAQKVDPTGLTAFMVVRAVARQYASEEQFSALDLLEKPQTASRLDDLRVLLNLVDNEHALQAVAGFQEDMRNATAHYGVTEACAETIEDMAALAYIRRDALVCTTLLQRHTFKRGQRSKIRLHYNEQVIQFWNVNSMIRAAAAQPKDGITLVLIQDPQVIEYSFFCFLIRDGENITIWSDTERCTHPLQKVMSRGRSRGRQLVERAGRLRFPYQFLKVSVTDKGDPIKLAGNEVVRTKVQATPIAPFSKMNPDQLLWFIMSLDVLRKAPHGRKLSVTGEGMTALSQASSRVLPAGCLEVQPLTSAEVTSEAIDQQLAGMRYGGYRSTGTNNWMEDRYGHLVDPRLLNLVSVQQAQPRESLWGDKPKKSKHALVTINRERVSARELLPKSKGLSSRQGYIGHQNVEEPSLIGIDPVAFGLPREMEADRLWVARWNQTQALGMAAQAEFDKRNHEVSKWFREHVICNAPAILSAAIKGSWIERFQGPVDDNADEIVPVTQRNLVVWHRKHPRGGEWPFPYFDRSISPSYVNLAQLPIGRSSTNPARCFLRESLPANVFVYFAPKTAVGIAMLAGCEVGDLPEPLVYWLADPPYTGNDLLNRTDPLDTAVGNPWRAFSFDVRLGLSKRAWNRLCRDANEQGDSIRWQVRSAASGSRWCNENNQS